MATDNKYAATVGSSMPPKLDNKPQGYVKDTNPKTPFGARKPPMFYVPKGPLMEVAVVHFLGHMKYAHFNWRDDPVSASTYANAIADHLFEWSEGRDQDPDSGVSPLAHIVANCLILMDAKEFGTLIDDRHVSTTDFEAIYERLKPHLEKINQNFGEGADNAKTRNKEQK